MRPNTIKWLLYSLLIVILCVTMIPLLWMLSASFMPAGEANLTPPRILPSRITFEHYQALFTRLNLTRYLVNSTLLATAVTLISLLLNSMAG